MKAKIIKKVSEKYVTTKLFERHMGSIAVSFAKVDERLDRHESVFQLIFHELKAIREDTSSMKSTLSSVVHHIAVHDTKIDNLTERVENLENNTNIKTA